MYTYSQYMQDGTYLGQGNQYHSMLHAKVTNHTMLHMHAHADILLRYRLIKHAVPLTKIDYHITATCSYIRSIHSSYIIMLTKLCDYILSRGAMISFLTKTLMPNKFNKVWSFHKDFGDLSMTVFLLRQFIGQHLC